MTTMTLDEFKADSKLIWTTLIKHHKPNWYRPLPNPNDEIKYGYDIYLAANNTISHILTLGDIKIRSDKILLSNFGTTAVTSSKTMKDLETKSTKTVQRDNRMLTHGAILNEQHWWPYFNYAWVLGGVHRLTPFHLGMEKMPSDEDLFDEEKEIPRVLGAEIFLLSISGYRCIEQPSGTNKLTFGMAFYPYVAYAALTVTMTDYVKALGDFSLEPVKEMLDPLNWVKWSVFRSFAKY